MKKALTLLMITIIGIIVGTRVIDCIVKKKSVDDVVDDPEYLTHEDYENAQDVNIDVPLV